MSSSQQPPATHPFPTFSTSKNMLGSSLWKNRMELVSSLFWFIAAKKMQIFAAVTKILALLPFDCLWIGNSVLNQPVCSGMITQQYHYIVGSLYSLIFPLHIPMCNWCFHDFIINPLLNLINSPLSLVKSTITIGNHPQHLLPTWISEERVAKLGKELQSLSNSFRLGPWCWCLW